MADTKKPEEKIADVMMKYLKIVGVNDVPDALVRQVSYRLGTKLNNGFEKDLTRALGSFNITSKKDYDIKNVIKDMIEFDVDYVGLDSGGGVSVKPSFNFDGNTITFSQVNKDLFTVVEKVLLVVLGKSTSQNIRTPGGFQFMHEIIKEFLDGFISGKFSDSVKEVNYFKRVCNDARDKIFGTDATVNTANVLKYQKYLKKEDALLPFKSLGDVSTDTRILFEIPFLADKAILIIEKHGFKYEEAVAIYNARFGCSYEPYTGTVLVCTVCHKSNTFFSPINNMEKCVCGQPLFRQCSKSGCGTQIPRIVDTCPQCGFRGSDISYYENIVATAKAFAEDGIIEKAEEYLIVAQVIAPHRKAELMIVQNKISNDKANRQRVIDEIEFHITNKNFYTAREKLLDAKRNVPKCDELLKDSESRITNAINNAENLFSTAGESTQKLQRVLAICADHAEAKKYRDRVPPKAPKYVGEPFVNSKNHVQISWNHSLDNDVKYHLVRKKGSQPVSATDGEMIAETDAHEATDTSPIPGLIYYAVFTKRGKRYSEECAYNFIELLPVVPEFTLRLQKDKRIELNYSIPKGAIGVKIKREVSSGKVDVLYEGTKTIAVDPAPPRICTYIINAVYDDNRESKGKKQSFNADTIPQEIKPQIDTKENLIHISWDTAQTGYYIKIIDIEGRGIPINVGDFCSESDIEPKKNELASVRCEELCADFKVETNRQYNLAVLIGNQNGYLCCEIYPFYAGKFPKLQLEPYDVEVDGTHSFLFEDTPPDDFVVYAISKQNKAPDYKYFKPGKIIKHARGGRFALQVQNLHYAYVGQYYIFSRFKLSDGSLSAPICSKVHFRQEIRIEFKLKQSGTTLTAYLNISLNKYDFEGYPELPQLNFQIDGNEYPMKKRSVSNNNRSFRITETIQLLAPVSNFSNVKMISTDTTFHSDFNIINQHREV